MFDISQLNPPQQKAVRKLDGPLMILAGAGTGKTRVITCRIAHMLLEGLPSEKIVALTFTNKAAREMRERLHQMVGSKPKGLFIGTFHSFCLKLLRTYPEACGLVKDFSLIGTSEQLSLVSKAIEERGWHGLYKPEALLARISNAKNCLLSPQEVATALTEHGTFFDPDPATLAVVYDLYERQLKLNRVIDFDDCIFKVVRMLRENAEVRQKCEEQFTHFLVDEFQDTNFAQLSVLEMLAARHRHICVVGDDDQSIYSWRGALTTTLTRFEEIFRETILIKLEQNYRCSNVILHAANTVIKINQGRKEKTLWSTSRIENPIVVSAHTDDNTEARWIARKCFALLGHGYAPKDIGILYRANAQARAVEVALREAGVRYKIFGGKSFFERKEVKDFLSYLRLSFHTHDRLCFWRIINTPARGLGLKSLERLDEESRKHDLSPFQIIQSTELLPLQGAQREAALQFASEIDRLRAQPIRTVADLVDRGREILKTFRLEDDIRAKTSHEGSRQRKLEALRRLPEWLGEVAQSLVEESGELDMANLLDSVMLSDDGRQKDNKDEGNQASLMTIHAAKGLEFPIVFVCGVEEDQLPHKNSRDSAVGLEEERRLFYVALTRAKERLFLSYAKERYSSFHRAERKPSRFLEEMPENGVIREDESDATVALQPEEKKERSLQRLSKLRDSLKTGFR